MAKKCTVAHVDVCMFCAGSYAFIVLIGCENHGTG